MKDVFCVDQLSFVKHVTSVTAVVSNLPVGARLQNFLKAWEDMGAGLKVVQILKVGYTLPFWIWLKLARSPTIINCYVNPHRNLYLLEALHQRISKRAVELLKNDTFIALIHPIQWTIAYPVGADRPAKRQKKTSCVSTG